MIIFPYRTDSVARKLPIVNLIFTSALLVFSLLFYFGKLNASIINSVILSHWGVIRIVGSVLIQPNLISILFVFIFLLLLGNAVNSVTGNIYYPIILFLFCCVFSGVHLITSDVRAIGGNGVVSGLAGFAIAILPSNTLVIYKSDPDEEEGFNLSSIILLWIIFGAYAIISFPSIPSLLSQIVSFAFGIILALLLVKFKIVKTIDPTLPEWLNDKVALLSGIDLIGAIMPISKKRNSDAEIKLKAEKLMELIDQREDNFSADNEIFPKPEELPSEPAIKFRLLKGIKQKDLITLYFAFEGDEISDVSITAENCKCEIYPFDKLKPGDSGSIKIFSSNIGKIDTVYLSVKYHSRGQLKTKEIIYSASSNEIKN